MVFSLLYFSVSGLVRDEYPQRNATTPRSFNYGAVIGGDILSSTLNTSMESENVDEEKVLRDNSTSEKVKFDSRNSSLASSYIVSIFTQQ